MSDDIENLEEFSAADWVNLLQSRPWLIAKDYICDALETLTAYEFAAILIKEPSLFELLDGFENLGKETWLYVLCGTTKLNRQAANADVLRKFTRSERDKIISCNIAFEAIFEQIPAE